MSTIRRGLNMTIERICPVCHLPQGVFKEPTGLLIYTPSGTLVAPLGTKIIERPDDCNRLEELK